MSLAPSTLYNVVRKNVGSVKRSILARDRRSDPDEFVILHIPRDQNPDEFVEITHKPMARLDAHVERISFPDDLMGYTKC